jgi:hypothetical protein
MIHTATLTSDRKESEVSVFVPSPLRDEALYRYVAQMLHDSGVRFSMFTLDPGWVTDFDSVTGEALV